MGAEFGNQTSSFSYQPHAWSGSVADFLNTSSSDLLSSLRQHLKESLLLELDKSQLEAWKQEIKILKSELKRLELILSSSSDWIIVLEYELPRERGRRPDVILIAGSNLFVLEFKSFRRPTAAALDQVSAYARDIKSYHLESHGRNVVPILVLTNSDEVFSSVDGVVPCGAESLADTIVDRLLPDSEHIDIDRWLGSPYAPLPSLVLAARMLFEHEPLPAIKRAQSAGIQDTLSSLDEIASIAESNETRHIALVTGVPGAGKTLVGLQFVYQVRASKDGSDKEAVFLSGNGPLVKVLQHALKTSVFVQDVHGFLRQYGGDSTKQPGERIWVYDEAQRAWDSDRVKSKRGHGHSEPDDLIRIGDRTIRGALIVGLIGEGQEIHLGEESGLTLWNEAIANSPESWTVHCPSKLKDQFTAPCKVVTDDNLDLTLSLRSHLAEDVQEWIRNLLDSNLEVSSALADRMIDAGFPLYLTRDLEEAKAYVLARYRNHSTKRFGILASSKAKNLVGYGVRNDWSFTKNLREGPWYNDDPNSRQSCCQLVEVATEFSCQGLELDLPIVCWGDDMKWNQGWRPRPQPRSQAINPDQLRINSYRVLLSRGRDGLLIWVPPDAELDGVYQALSNAGMRRLQH